MTMTENTNVIVTTMPLKLRPNGVIKIYYLAREGI